MYVLCVDVAIQNTYTRQDNRIWPDKRWHCGSDLGLSHCLDWIYDGVCYHRRNGLDVNEECSSVQASLLTFTAGHQPLVVNITGSLNLHPAAGRDLLAT